MPAIWNILTETHTFKHAESKSEEFPLRRPAVFSQTAILSSPISQELFPLFSDTHGWRHTDDALLKMTNSCEPVPTFNKRPFCLDYVILSALDVNNISWLQHWPSKLRNPFLKFSSASLGIKSQGRWCQSFELCLWAVFGLCLWAMSLGWETIAYMRSKCIIQRY